MEQAIVKGYNDASRLFLENKPDAALAICLSLLKSVPTNSAVLNLAGSALYRKEMLPEAENLLLAANEIAPETEEITLNLVRVLKKRNQPQRAVEVLERGLVYAPESPRLLSALGETLYYENRFEEAMLAFERLLTVAPNDVEGLFRLACAYQECDRTEAAFEAYKQVLANAPDHAGACVNLAQIHKSLGNHDKSEEFFTRSAELVPEDPAYASRTLFCMNYGFAKGAQFLERAEQWADQYTNPLLPARPPRLRAKRDDRIKLGFVSADFSLHPVGRLFLPVLERLDQSRFDIHCFSNVQLEDAMTAQFREVAPNFNAIRHLDDDAACSLIQNESIDILIDLSGHSNGNRLGVLARKPAPIQITWLGYFNTTGMQAIDYVIGDHVNIPAGNERHYTEKVLRLADTFFPYSLPDVTPPCISEQIETVTFGCFNDSAKLNDRVLTAWGEILNCVPNSRLLLKSRTLSDQWVRDLFIERAMQNGIPPHTLIFLGPSSYHDYLHSYAKVDIALDPFPYSGGATTADALFTGTPVLTCPFDSFGSRLSASILQACDMPELICRDLDDYVSKAISLANDAPQRNEIAETLRRTFTTSRFCDLDRFTRDFEQVLLNTLN